MCMRKILLGVLLTAVVAGSSAQQTKTTPKKVTKKAPATKAVAFKLDNTLLWQISGNNLSSSSYLFGTMHILCEDDAKMSDSLRYSIDETKQIFFEIDLDNMMETLGALRYLNMNGNVKLSDLLTEEEYSRVKTYFTKHKTMLPLGTIERMKPYFITALISESKFPCATKGGMEQVIMKEAKKDQKPIKGLETVKFQASVFDSIPYKRQAKDLLRMIDSADSNTDSSDSKLLDVYRSQDINAMQEMTSMEEGMSDFIDLLLYNRNATWAKQIPLIMKENPTLFAVGAGHLGGEKGIINLLRQAGYTLRPMRHRPGLVTLSN
jgi:uncharacterized protein